MFECDQCPKVFVRRDFFERHKQKHSLTQSTPDGAEQVTPAVSKLTHEVCPVCSKAVSRKFSLERHMRYHRTNKQFTCEKCNKSYVERYGLLRHIQSMHCDGSGEQQEHEPIALNLTSVGTIDQHYTYDCVLCGVSFKYKDMIETHFATAHHITGRLRISVA